MSLIAVERQGSLRAQTVAKGKIAIPQPIVNQIVETEAHLMTDQYHSYRSISFISAYWPRLGAHSTINQLGKEYAYGDIPPNPAESFTALLERIMLGGYDII